MAIYDATATLTISVVVERQIDARNVVFAKQEMERVMGGLSDLRDAVIYDVQVDDVNAKRSS